ncbi:MAG: NAD(P)H-dependent oxidoreductase [Acidimicrobiales bacterium]
MAELLVVVGNPKPASRTRLAAERVAERLAAGVPELDPPRTLELAELAGELFDWGAERAGAEAAAAQQAGLLVVATPTFKASYTGLLKAFLDRIPAGGLDLVTAVPVMLGGAADHRLAVETHLRPLLVELGAACPTAGLFLLDDALGELDSVLEPWLAVARPRVAALVAAQQKIRAGS